MASTATGSKGKVPARTSARSKAGSTAKAKSPVGVPTLEIERSFLSSGVRFLAGVDEVGRGALAGPVSVGIAVVDLEEHGLLAEVKDSKLLKPEDRDRLEPLVREWAVASAVGHASSREIDDIGIIAALRLAGTRAWLEILAGGITPDVVLLDGSHNWLSPDVQASLFDSPDLGPWCEAPVHTRIKADMSCLSVAAASVLAKVARDRIMVDLHSEVPSYGWNVNKGYATAAHRDVIRLQGPSVHHRTSWNLTGPEEVGIIPS
ncbi:ribonuclease HII [Paenarthrobacter aurescens]|uniref:ribonuclease HII n=1 Tax=Paenarthrobacter aurescens TaxID=43663 RepID=UPI0011421355|nr:ribonuclease HII [Paenarthrobacter aurescens]MDO6143873.1 ribonuclease HII [Paenarthrobacter aurescens]MDO6147720.1 ribonuclease HII [Paenarthrobacter aurescens]MDO6158964.1 ribonuclease HII [Paenarthrobacter aurescens]MDO6162948.1 ribonuclease HII [Paenarthrobacter aurescens]